MERQISDESKKLTTVGRLAAKTDHCVLCFSGPMIPKRKNIFSISALYQLYFPVETIVFILTFCRSCD